MILTSLNGYGKSTILRIIDGINKFNLIYFQQLYFKEIICYFDDDSHVKFEKESDNLIINGNIVLNNKILFKVFKLVRYDYKQISYASIRSDIQFDEQRGSIHDLEKIEYILLDEEFKYNYIYENYLLVSNIRENIFKKV